MGEGSAVIAGGTALVIMMKENILTPKLLVDISRVKSLKGITYDDVQGLSVGAMTTHKEIEESEEVARHYPSLRDAFHTIGNPRIRAVGTIGGNLAYAEPQCNPPAILAALGATLEIVGPDGTRLSPADGFIKGIFESDLRPGELITRVIVPPPSPRSATKFFKFTTKSESDKPTATVAVSVELDEGLRRIARCMIVVGAVGPRTYRCPEAERMIESAEAIASIDYFAVARAASAEFEAMDDAYGPEWYKKQVATSIIRDLVAETVEAAARGEGTR